MQEVTTATGAHLFKFDSMTDVKEYTDAKLWKQSGRKEFIGADIETWEDADFKTIVAWKEGQEVLAQYIERLQTAALPEIKSRMRKTEWSFDDGDEIDLDRMQQGLPYRRRTVREAGGSGPAEMTIIIDTTTPFFQKSMDVLWRGAAAVALTHILEEKGYRVELWVSNGSRLWADDPKPVMTCACLKRTSDPLDTSTLINTVSGWFYRSITFTLLETICAKNNHLVEYGYGNCASPMPKDLDSISTDELRVYSSGVYSYQGAYDMILAEVERVVELTAGEAAEA